MTIRNLKLIIPDLAETLPNDVNLPSLQYLLNRSISTPITHKEALICQWFNISDFEFPVAAIIGLGDHLPTQTNYWLRADPVQLQADLSTAYLLGNQHLNLQADEMKILVNSINKLIASDDLQLFAPHPTRWYLLSKQPLQIKTCNLQQAMNKDIANYLPQGERQAYWRRLFTEIQMLLHASPINQKRQAHGLPTINAVWFWGAGQLPSFKPGAWQTIWCYDDPLLKGLSQLINCSAKPLSDNFSQILQRMETAGDYLLQLSAQSFESNWEKLEFNWLKPIWQALRHKNLSQIDFYIGTMNVFTITAKRSQYFWKKRYPLINYLDYEKKNNSPPTA